MVRHSLHRARGRLLCMCRLPLATAVFVHQSQIRSNGFRYLKEGEAVEYDVQTTDRGVVASDVTAPGGVPLHLAREDNGDEQM